MLEVDDDVTMAASNVSKGYYDEDNSGMIYVPPTTQHQKSEQVNKMVTPFFSPKQPMDKMCMEFHCATAGTPRATKCRYCFQHHATETRSGVRHFGVRRHMKFLSGRSPSSKPENCRETHHHYAT